MNNKKILIYSAIAHLIIILLLLINNMNFKNTDTTNNSKKINNELLRAQYVELSTIPDMAISKKTVEINEIKEIEKIENKNNKIIKKEEPLKKHNEIKEKETEISNKNNIKTNNLSEKPIFKEKKIDNTEINETVEKIKKIIEQKEVKKENQPSLLKESKTSSLNSIEGENEMSKYRDLIYEVFYSNWSQPQYIEKGWTCRVMIQQNINGEIIDAQFYNDCEVNNQFKGSVKEAIAKSYKLPLPKNKEIFNEYIEINFRIR